MITSIDILTGRFSIGGAPYINVSNASQAIVTNLVFSKNGAPWYGYALSATPDLGNIKAISNVDWVKAKKMNGIDVSNVKTMIEIKG